MLSRGAIAEAARAAGLDLCGVVRAASLADGPDVGFFYSWLESGFHADMGYLTGERAAIRAELDRLLPGVRSVICLALNYNTPLPYSTELSDATRAWISRYSWGEDYHNVLREKLERFVADLGIPGRACVDTSPVLERALARRTPVGWLAKNTCVINQKLGSWFFLGEVLTTEELQPDAPAHDRCGSCTRCIDACPTGAIVQERVLDSRRCISYWTIEAKGAIPPGIRPHLGRHVFGCDICQDVCPWNRETPATGEAPFQPREGLFNPPLAELARLSEEQFNKLFRNSPVRRPKYRGFMRNVCVAVGNSGDASLAPDLERLAAHPEPLIREHARWALERLSASTHV